MKEIDGKSILVRVSARVEFTKVLSFRQSTVFQQVKSLPLHITEARKRHPFWVGPLPIGDYKGYPLPLDGSTIQVVMLDC